LEVIPSTNAIEVVKAQTTAEWLDGIPPVLQIVISMRSRVLPFLPLNINIIVFKICAVHKAHNADKNTGFKKRSFNPEKITELFIDILRLQYFFINLQECKLPQVKIKPIYIK
jgi:hypothetical protein